MSLLASSCCRSRPLIPGSRTSSTRQLRASRGALAKNSCAEENACTFSPAERSRLLRLARIDDATSIMQTSGLFSFMGLPLKKHIRGWSIDSLLSRSLPCLTNQSPEVNEILLDLGPSRLRRTAEDSQSLSGPDKVSQRPRPHLLHHVTAMNLDGFFGCAQLMGDLLVEHTRCDMSHHFTFPYRERVITLAQVFELCSLSASCPIEINCPAYSVQKILFTERLGQKIGRTCFHRLDCHRDVPMAGDEDDRDLHACFGQFSLQIQTA